ncbi:hypothetical protein [Mucilaginibacter gynuensis]
MEKKEILVIGTNPGIIQTIVRLINNNELWNGTGVLSADDAVNAFENNPFDVVLFGGGLLDDEEKELSIIFRAIKADIPLVKHYGGGSGLLSCEIYQALGV